MTKLNREQWCNKLHQAIIDDDEDNFLSIFATAEIDDDTLNSLAHVTFRTAYDLPDTKYLWHLVNLSYNNIVDLEFCKNATAFKAIIIGDRPLFMHMKNNYTLSDSCLKTCKQMDKFSCSHQ